MAKPKKNKGNNAPPATPALVRRAEQLDNDEFVEIESGDVPGEVQRLKNEYASSEMTVTVLRAEKRGGRFERIPETFNGDDFDPDALAREYGGGIYRYTIRDASGEYLSKWTTYYAMKSSPVMQAPVVKQEDTNVRDLTQFMIEQNRTHAEQQSKSQEKNDMMMIKFVEMMNGSMRAISEASRPKETKLDEILKFKQLFGENKSNMGEFLGAVKFVSDMQGANGSGDGGTLTEKVVLNIVEKLFGKAENMNILQRVLQQKMQDPQAVAEPEVEPEPETPVEPAKTLPAPAETSPAVELASPVEGVLLTEIGRNIKRIAGFAKLNYDAGIVTDFIVEGLSDSDYDQLKQYLEKYGSARIIMRYPELAPYKAWLSRLSDDIVHCYDDDTPATPETPATLETPDAGKPSVN